VNRCASRSDRFDDSFDEDISASTTSVAFCAIGEYGEKFLAPVKKLAQSIALERFSGTPL
jgi:hypothetical protein